MVKRYCPNCDEIREMRTEHKPETYPVRGENITVDADVLVCSTCGESISDPELDDRTLRNVYAAYRQRHGLLQPEEIRRIGERYGLSLRALARLLGWGLVTIQRYEAGALQNEAHDQVLRSLDNPEVVRGLLARRGERLPGNVRTRVERAISETVQPWTDRLVEVTEKLLTSRGTAELHGFREVNLERIGELVAWLARTCPGTFKTKLAKLLWLVDFTHFRRHRVSITGLAYARLPYGPVPDEYQLLLASLEAMGMIRLEETTVGPYTGEVVVAAAEAGLDDFTETERAIIQLIADRFGCLSATELSHRSHKESAWMDHVTSDLISYTESDEVSMLDDLDVTESRENAGRCHGSPPGAV